MSGECEKCGHHAVECQCRALPALPADLAGLVWAHLAPEDPSSLTIERSAFFDALEALAGRQAAVTDEMVEAGCIAAKKAFSDKVLSGSLQQHMVRAILSAAPPAPQAAEEHPDDAAVDRFATAMKAKMKWAREHRGRSGWDNPKVCTPEYLARHLVEHLTKGNPGTFEDVANFCMMLHQRGCHPAVLSEALSTPPASGKVEAEAVRFDPVEDERGLFEGMAIAANGQFMRYSDHASTVAAMQAEIERLRRERRWTVERDGEFLHVCRGDHDKAEKCEWESFVPASRLKAAEAELAKLREGLEPFSKFAGIVFERNFNNDDLVDTITASDGGQSTLYARDFFRARALLKGETE